MTVLQRYQRALLYDHLDAPARRDTVIIADRRRQSIW
jgi:hypothetical protein